MKILPGFLLGKLLKLGGFSYAVPNFTKELWWTPLEKDSKEKLSKETHPCEQVFASSKLQGHRSRDSEGAWGAALRGNKGWGSTEVLWPCPVKYNGS